MKIKRKQQKREKRNKWGRENEKELVDLSYKG